MNDDGGQAGDRANAGRRARGFSLADVFGAFWRPGAEALQILGGGKPPSDAAPEIAGAGIMPPTPTEPEEETG